MRASRSARLNVVLCLSAIGAAPQGLRESRIAGQTSIPNRRVSMAALPKPPPKYHPPDTRGGTGPCGYGIAFVNCGGSGARNTPGSGDTSGNSGPSKPQPGAVGGGAAWPIGIGVGATAGATLWAVTEPVARQIEEVLSRDGPQFPPSLRMSNFRVTGFAKGGWPVVVDYAAEPGAYVVLTVITQDAPAAEAVLAVPEAGRRLQLLRLPTEFGTTLKSASFSIDATASATDSTPRYLRIYGFGVGPKAVGSVAIDNLVFGPQTVTAAQPDANFGFHAHTDFDKMKAEFMQVEFVNNSLEAQLFDNANIKGRVPSDTNVNEQWSAKKAKAGPIQFRMRGWMTVRGNEGGDWVSAFSPDLVLKQ
jgi:hypothetical protein